MAKILDFVNEHHIHTVLLDAMGTIYDNRGPYDGVVEAISTLQKQGVQVLVATNNTTRSVPGIRHYLLAFGIDIAEDLIISSGLVLRDVPEFRACVEGKKVFVVGSSESDYYVELAGGLVTRVLAESEAIVLASSFASGNENWMAVLRQFIVDHPQVPLICINPDRYVQHDGARYPVIGYYVDELIRESGGAVLFGGKPEPSFSVCVKTVLEQMKIPVDRGVLFCDDNPHNVLQLSTDLDIHGAYLKDTGLPFDLTDMDSIYFWEKLV